MARHGARACPPRRSCSSATVTGRLRSSWRRRPWRSRLGNVDAIVLSEAELALLAMDGGRWAEAAEHLQLALATVDECRLDDYALSVLAFAAAARLAVHRGDREEADRQLARAMRARPSCTFVLPHVAVRVRLQLAKMYAALADQATARHLLREIDDISAHRPALGALVDEVSEFRGILTVERAGSCGRRTAPHPRGASAAPLPADPPHVQADRGAAVRVPQHRQLRSRLDLSKTGRLLTQRRGATRDGGRPARRVAEITADGCSRASSTSYPAPSPDSAPPRQHWEARRRKRRRAAPQRSRRPSHQHSPPHRPPLRRTAPRHRPPPARRGGPGRVSSDRASTDSTPLTQSSAKCSSLIASRRSTSV